MAMPLLLGISIKKRYYRTKRCNRALIFYYGVRQDLGRSGDNAANSDLDSVERPVISFFMGYATLCSISVVAAQTMNAYSYASSEVDEANCPEPSERRVDRPNCLPSRRSGKPRYATVIKDDKHTHQLQIVESI
jgi:hypothetical protein